MKPVWLKLGALSCLTLLAACTTVPTGPSVMALPGNGKSFDQFRMDDMICRQYASAQVGGSTANDAAIRSQVGSAAVGAAVGALAGAAMGGHEGAGTGAGIGLLGGTLVGTGTSQQSAYGTQRQYDNAYVQCMYAKGNQVPVHGSVMRGYSQQPGSSLPPPPPSSGYTPPPGATYGPPPGSYVPPAEQQ
ncbi:MAG: glycine zipper family protein [Betaproteobacteria bacterium]|nr:glycine zipper family protein [Betaproteobacteria bacterium]